MNALCIRFDPDSLDSSKSSDWALVSDNGKILQHGSSALEELSQLEQLNNAKTAARVIVIVTGDRVLTTTVSVEAGHVAHAKNILPFLVEEQLAQELEDVHIALPDKVGPGTNNVAVVSHTDMIQWLEELYMAGLAVEEMLPEYLLAPNTSALENDSTELRIMVDGRRVILQYSDAQGTVVDADNAGVYVDLYFARQLDSADSLDAGHGRAIELIVCESDAIGRKVVQQLNQSLGHYPLRMTLYNESAFHMQAITAAKQSSGKLNLLQGGYQANIQTSENTIWKRIATIAAIFLVANTAMLLGSGWWFNKKADSLHQAAVDEYRDIFPNERRVVNPRRQFQSHLNRQQSATFSAEFLYLLQELSQAMPDTSVLPIKSLRYDAYGNGLLVELQTETMDVLEQYTRRLASEFIQVELLSANNQGEFVNGRIRLEAI